MRFSLLLAAVAVLAVGGQAAQPMTRAEVLGLFFKTASARQQFDQALEGVMALGLPGIGPLMGQWRGQGKGATSGQVRAPWEAPTVRHQVQRVLDDGIDTLVEQVRRLIEAAAEPLKIDRISLNQSSALVQSVGDITQVAVSHLSTFNIVDRDVDVPTVSANLTVDFEKLDMHGLYNVDATASDQLHIFGDGRFDVRLYRPTVQITIQLGYGDEHFSVEDLSIYVKLQKLKVVMSNFLGGGEVGDLVCGIVSDVGPAFLDMYREEVNQVVSMEVKRTTNALLNKLPINKIIDWIMGGGDDNNDDPTDN